MFGEHSKVRILPVALGKPRPTYSGGSSSGKTNVEGWHLIITMEKESSLSKKIETVGFYHEVEFKDKEGNSKLFPATKGEDGLKVKDVKEFLKRLKERGLKRTLYPKYLLLTYDDLLELAGEELSK